MVSHCTTSTSSLRRRRRMPFFRELNEEEIRRALGGFYRGFSTSLDDTVPAKALYMGALEATKSALDTATLRLGVIEPVASAAAPAIAGISAAVAA
ncbi:mitochondrial substrate carrier family protein E-like isoform X2 [Canna indica]|uniref:Mitochondrial substrate carrier family protein E-like isoform X2 n=1 Tax=Canna indica TaxID=4628 RepID=A0AAQ3KB02_9LILI|nr:mitochondrial substrate carrier family protein E-like isoform X2 [Canna indica]